MTAAVFMVMIDFVMDPLSVLGDRWFLGRIFWYDPPGPHFGVKVVNYLGWYLVAAITVAIFQYLDPRMNRGTRKPLGVAVNLPSRALFGPFLYAGIVAFGVTMLFRIGAGQIGWCSTFIFIPFLTLIVNTLTRRDSYGDSSALARHLNDFPYEKSLPVWGVAELPRSAPARRRA
jgi:putative membrane protein